MMLSSWNTLGVDLCSMWHNSRLFQAGAPGHCQDRGGNVLPQLAWPRSGADYSGSIGAGEKWILVPFSLGL